MGAGITIQGLTAGAFPDIAAFEVLKPGTNEINRGTSGGVPPWLGSLGICSIVLVYVFFGGMRGTAWANAFQTAFFMTLGGVTFYDIANKLGNQESFLENLRAISAEISEEKATRTHISHTRWSAYLLIPLSVAMFPHVFQHWLTAKSAKSFKLPVVMHPFFVLLVWVPCVLIGVWATTGLMPTQPPLPALPDGSVNANAILPFMVNTMTNDWLAGLLAAGILAAIMSSLDSQFLCIGTIFNNDMVTHYAGKDRFSDKQQIWMTRAFIVFIVAVTYLLNLMNYRSVFSMAIWCFTGYAALFPVVFAAIYWRRLTAAGAISGILVMLATWSYFFWQSGFGKVKPSELPLLATFLGTCASMVAVSLLTKPPAEAVLNRFFPSAETQTTANVDS